MARLSSIVYRNVGLLLPVRGVDGYAGEPDGKKVFFAAFEAKNRAEIDALAPAGLPPGVRLHWAEYCPGRGWAGCFGLWSHEVEPDADYGQLRFF